MGGQFEADAVLGFPCGRANVRGQGHFGVGQEVSTRRGFPHKHVQACARDLAGVQGRHQGVFVHGSATRRIHQNGVRLHGLQLRLANHSAAVGLGRHVDAHHVGVRQHIFKAVERAIDRQRLSTDGQFNLAVVHERVVGNDIHAAAQGVAGQRPADAAEAHNAEGLAPQLCAFAVGLLECFEFFGAAPGHLAVAVGQEAGAGEQVSHDQFCHALRAGGWGVEHGQALSTCIFHVDVVHADPASANEFQGGAGVDEGLANLGGRAHQHPVDGVLVDEGFKSVGVDKVGVQRVPGRGQSCGA